MRTQTLKPFGENLHKNDFRVTICDNNLELSKILAETFQGIEEVEVVFGNIFHLWADAIVSPANSFGEMSGGLDKAIDDFYKGEAQKRVQVQIREDYLGELPVGKAITLQMNSLQFPNLMVFPTMRIPGTVKETINAYLAMRATFVELIRMNKKEAGSIKTIVIPSLCTGVGRMPYKESAEQMFTAYKNIMLSGWMDIVHPAMAPYALKNSKIN
ncbi:MAG: macro domain-containing protein [Bacteroidota bacterium]